MKKIFILLVSSFFLANCATFRLVPITEPTIIHLHSRLDSNHTYVAIVSALANTTKEDISRGMKMGDDVLTMTFGERYTRAKGSTKWFYEARDKNIVFAAYYDRSHVLRVAIAYDDQKIVITITGSQNLNQTDTHIHKNAYVWLGILERDIRIQIGHIDKQLVGKESTTQDSHKNTGIINPEAFKWNELSNKSLQQKNWTEAIRTASAAIQIDPNYDMPYANRAWAYVEKGFFSEAIKAATTAIELNPNNMYAFNNRGLAYQMLGDTTNAFDNYKKSCLLGLEIGCTNYDELVEERVKLLLDESYKEFLAKNWGQVIQLSEQIIILDPKNDIAYVNRGGAYAEMNELKKALQDINKAISINPNNSIAYNNRGFVYELMGETKRAALEYEISCNLGLQQSCNDYKRMSK